MHDFDALWKHRKFLKSDGKPFLHHDRVAALLDAILLPESAAVCEHQAYANDFKRISAGNARAHAAAEAAASKPPPTALLRVPSPLSAPASLTALQTFATDEEKVQWRSSQQPCVAGPRRPAWAGPPGERGNVDLICAAQATAETVSVSQAAQPLPEKPLEHLKVDFTELTPRKGKKYCLVMVDVRSKWSFAKALLAEIIPRWGIPAKISSDKGALLVMKLSNKREKVWALIWANMAC